MNLIQPLLVAGLLLIGVVYLNRFRSRIIDTIIIGLIHTHSDRSDSTGLARAARMAW